MSQYQSGFGNEHATEAVSGALPHGQNSPQRPPLGLYAEQLSGTPFTTPRAAQRRSWLYRIRPSADHPAYRPIERGLLRSGPFTEVPPEPNRLRWDPLPLQAGDWLSSLVTLAGCGEPNVGGVAVHLYATKESMTRVFYDADGELVFVPQAGGLRLCTEMGIIEVQPGEIAVVPRGVKFRVELLDAEARGYVGESYGPPLRLPELGPIGSNSLANARDFQYPVAWFEERGATEVVQKFEGHLFSTTLDHSPLDVVAWHGTHAPYKYDLARFNTIGTVSFDHPDPSIFTVLTSPSEIAGTANVDFVIFPPRWMVAEHTFRPPWFHRNVMNELMGLVKGAYDAKAEGFVPGGSSLHNCMSAHGPDAATTAKAMAATLAPAKIDDTLAFMFETRLPLRPTKWAMESATRQPDYDACWRGFPGTFRR